MKTTRSKDISNQERKPISTVNKIPTNFGRERIFPINREIR